MTYSDEFLKLSPAARRIVSQQSRYLAHRSTLKRWLGAERWEIFKRIEHATPQLATDLTAEELGQMKVSQCRQWVGQLERYATRRAS